MLNIREITDFSAPELDIYARLSEVQLLRYYEPKTGIFIAESPKVTERALDAGYVPISFLVEKQFLETNDSYQEKTGTGAEIPQRLHARLLMERCTNVPIYTASMDVLSLLTGFPLTKGMLCAMYRKPLPTVENICAGSERIAVLENITNPTNVGAIFRSAAALNMDAVLLTPACSDPLYRRAVRVSMGTVFQIPWTFFPDSFSWPEAGIRQLKELGFQTISMSLREDSMDIDDPAFPENGRLAVILGAEGDGLIPATIANCDYAVRIPMSHGVDSLNVAAAGAVVFWQLRRRNNKK